MQNILFQKMKKDSLQLMRQKGFSHISHSFQVFWLILCLRLCIAIPQWPLMNFMTLGNTSFGSPEIHTIVKQPVFASGSWFFACGHDLVMWGHRSKKISIFRPLTSLLVRDLTIIEKRGVRDKEFRVGTIAFDQFYTDLEKKNFRGLNVPGPKCAGA